MGDFALIFPFSMPGHPGGNLSRRLPRSGGGEEGVFFGAFLVFLWKNCYNGGRSSADGDEKRDRAGGKRQRPAKEGLGGG